MALFVYPPITLSTSGIATEAKQDDIIAELVDVNSELDTQTTALGTLATEATAATLATEATAATLATEATAATLATESTASSIDGKVSTETKQDTIIAALEFDVVDQLDTNLLDTSSSNIPGSASLPLEVVASLAADVTSIQLIEDIGEFYGVYTGIASSEVLVAVAPLGGGTVQVEILSGTRVSLKALESSAISIGKLAVNFVG